MRANKVSISGFSMCRNAESLYYPVKESIESILPIVDEFVVAVGKGQQGDQTRELIESIGSPKIRIIDTVWDTEKFRHGSVHAQQTDIAKESCKGDWLIYLQADEVIHEKDHTEIVTACSKYHSDERVEGFVLNYLHFWGDFHHVHNSHVWYDQEVRIIRNQPNIHSWVSAQSFRKYDDFHPSKYLSKEGTHKLNVLALKSEVFHYGWVRPPELMTKKINALDKIHSHEKERQSEPFSYGDLDALPRFEGSHPSVMKQWIEKSKWVNDGNPSPKYLRHNKKKAKAMTWIETRFLGGRKVFTNHNFNLIKGAD